MLADLDLCHAASQCKDVVSQPLVGHVPHQPCEAFAPHSRNDDEVEIPRCVALLKPGKSRVILSDDGLVVKRVDQLGLQLSKSAEVDHPLPSV